jgi:uncharacterized caspase-like protein
MSTSGRPIHRMLIALLVTVTPALALPAWAQTPQKGVQVAYATGLPVQNAEGVGKAWALLVGISDYPQITGMTIGSLRTPTRDVDALAKFLTDPDGGRFDKDAVTVLKDADATRVGILGALNSLVGSVARNDLVLFYFSGHGYRLPAGDDLPGDGVVRTAAPAFLVPHDVHPSVKTAPQISCIGYDQVVDIIGRMPAEKVVVILDACHSGGFKPKGAKAGPGTLVNRAFRDQWDAARGRPLLLSSGADQVSWEDKDGRHSVFTKFLLRGLQGEADLDGNAIVGFSEVADYLEGKVPAYTRQNFPSVQTPTRRYDSVEFNGDIPLAVNRPRWDAIQQELWDARTSSLSGSPMRRDVEAFSVQLLTRSHSASRAGKPLTPRQTLLVQEIDQLAAGETSPSEFELLARLLSQGGPETQIELTSLNLDVSPADATIAITHSQAPEHVVSLPASQDAYRVPAGVYNIDVARTGYRGESRDGVKVAPGGVGGQHRIALLGYAHILYADPPIGVQVRIDGEPVTLPFQTVEGEHGIELTRPDFAPYREKVTLGKDDRRYLAPDWRRARATVTIQSEPPGASVFLDGTPQGTTPVTLQDQPTGPQQLELALEDHEPLSESIDVTEGQGPIRRVLERSTGTLLIQSDPDTATVVLNGERVGVTPYTGKINTGPTTLTVTKARYRTVARDLDVARGTNTPLSLTLDPQQATLTVQSTPPGASVRLDATDLPQATPTTQTVEPKRYSVSVTLPDHEQYIREIEIKDRDEVVLDAPLRHKTQVRVTSEPTGLEVDLGDLGVHRTPALLDRVDAGAYEARLSVKGYRPVVRSFEVEEYERNTVRLELQPKSRAAMVYRSVAAPGFGQYSGDRKTSGGLFFAATLTAGALAAVTHMRYGSAVDSFEEAHVVYLNATTSAEIQRTELDRARARDDVDDAFDQRKLWVGVTGALWLANVIHALVSGPGIAEIGAQDPPTDVSYLLDVTPGTFAGLSYRLSF